MIASAQISIYPLRQERLSPAIDIVRGVLVSHGFEPQIGTMSTTVVGEDRILFAALGEAFGKTAEAGEVVMTITVSNACPIPD